MDKPSGEPSQLLKDFDSRYDQICSVRCYLYAVADCPEIIQQKQFLGNIRVCGDLLIWNSIAQLRDSKTGGRRVPLKQLALDLLKQHQYRPLAARRLCHD